MESLRNQLTATQDELTATTTAYHETLDAKERIEAIVVDMRDELRKNSDLIAETRSARDERVEQLTRELENERRTVADLRPTIAKLKEQLAFQAEQLALQEEQVEMGNEHEFEMTTLYTQLSEARTRIDQLTGEIAKQREELADRVELVAHLQQERNDAYERLAQVQMAQSTAPVVTPPRADAIVTEVTVSAGPTPGSMRNDDRRGMIYTRPPAESDDLKRITGVAEKPGTATKRLWRIQV